MEIATNPQKCPLAPPGRQVLFAKSWSPRLGQVDRSSIVLLMEPLEVLASVLFFLAAFLTSELLAPSVPVKSLVLAIETLRSAGPFAWVLLFLALINLALLVVALLILVLVVRTLNSLPRSEDSSSSRARSSPETPAPQIDLATVVMDDLARIDDLEVYAQVVEEHQCTICLEEMLDGGVKTLPCLHEFHEECIDAWLNDHTTCPICRATPQI